MINKILKVVLLVMTIVTLAELGYFYKISRPAMREEAGPQKTSPEPSGIATPAIHPEVLSMLNRYKYDPGAKMTITSETKTKIVEIDTKPRAIKGREFVYGMKITPGVINEEPYWMFLPSHVVDKLQIFELESNEEVPIKITDLKAGDEITITELYDPFYAPTDPKQVIDFKIVKT